MIRKNRDVCLLSMLHRKSGQRSDSQTNAECRTADIQKEVCVKIHTHIIQFQEL